METAAKPLSKAIEESGELIWSVVAELKAKETALDVAAQEFEAVAARLFFAWESAETMRNFALAYLPSQDWKAYRSQYPRPRMPEGNNPPKFFPRPRQPKR